MKPNLLLNRIPAVALVFVIICGPLFSASLFEETFNYSNGNLAGNGAWSGGEGSWSVTNGTAVVKGDGGSTSSLAISPINATASNSFYFSLNISSLEAGTNAALNDSLVFQTYNGTSYVDVFAIGIAYSYNSTSEVVSVSVRSTINGGTYNNFTNDASLALGTSNTIVGKFTFAEGETSATLSLWWNPEDESSATFRTFTLTTPTDVENISRLLLRRQTSANNGANVSTTFDNIRIGTDWVSATTSSIPESGTYAAVMGAIALATLAGVRWWRR